MTAVYLINVGANTKDSRRARSPVFGDGSFIYVSFTTDEPQAPPGYASRSCAVWRSSIRTPILTGPT
jgi:hypothetical protein